MLKLASRIRRTCADPGSLHRRIATGFIWVSLFVLLGKAAGAAKEMAIAWRYGVSATVDAYVLVINVVSLPISLWFAVLSVVLLPIVARLRTEAPEELPAFRGELLGVTLLGGVLLGVITWLGLPVLLRTELFGLTGEAALQAAAMAGPLSVLLPIGTAISLLSAWLMARGKHRNTLLEAVPALIVLVAVLLPEGSLPQPLVAGTILGFALQVIGLAWPLSRIGELDRPVLRFDSPVWKAFLGGVGLMAVGQALMSLTGIVDQFFAAHLETGAVSTLSYASRVISLLVSLGAIAIGRSTLPVFSDLISRRPDEVRSAAMKWAGGMFVLGVVVATFTWWAAPWIIELLFQRGSFTADDSLAVSRVLRYFLLQVPFYFAGLVLLSLLSAQRAYTSIYRAALSGAVAKGGGLVLLFPSFGMIGIVVSTAVMYLVSLVVMLLALRVEVG